MLHSIRTTREPLAQSDEPLDLLVACHVRLRHFSALALALATREDLDAQQIADGCERVLKYFEVALPLHEADEEESVTKAVRAIATAAEIAALEQMRNQHELLHDVLAELFPRWRKMEPSGTEAHARRLASVLEMHLDLEEKTIFPMLARLPDAERKRVASEFRARRESF